MNQNEVNYRLSPLSTTLIETYFKAGQSTKVFAKITFSAIFYLKLWVFMIVIRPKSSKLGSKIFLFPVNFIPSPPLKPTDPNIPKKLHKKPTKTYPESVQSQSKKIHKFLPFQLTLFFASQP
jgi:hypothetical protein